MYMAVLGCWSRAPAGASEVGSGLSNELITTLLKAWMGTTAVSCVVVYT